MKIHKSRGAGAAKPLKLLGSCTDCVYHLCPDRKCGGFEAPKFLCPRCPKKAKRAVICWNCKATIVVAHDYSSFCRVDCKCGASVFTLMAPIHRRHNLRLKSTRRPRKVLQSP
jgi:hypothetical protein